MRGLGGTGSAHSLWGWSKQTASCRAFFASSILETLIHVEIVSSNYFARVCLPNFLQELLFATSLATFRCSNLIATCVAAMEQDQQPGFRFGSDCPKFLRRCVKRQAILLPCAGDQVE